MKRLVLLVVLVGLFVLMGAGSVYAIPKVPSHAQLLDQSCAVCTSTTEWLPTQLGDTAFHGGFSNVYANVSGLTLTGANYWQRYLSFGAYNGGIQVLVGYDVNNFCKAFGSDEHLFYRVGSNTGCYTMSSADKTDIFTLGVSYYSSNGGGTFVWIEDTDGDSTINCAPCSFPTGTGGEFFANMSFFESVQDTWTGTLVTRDHWQQNKYDDQNSVIAYWKVTAANLLDHNPPQFYWGTQPQSSTTGGDFVSCDITGVNTC